MNALNMLIDASVHPISSSAREMALLVSVQPRVWSEHWSMCFWVTWTRIRSERVEHADRRLGPPNLLQRQGDGIAGQCPTTSMVGTLVDVLLGDLDQDQI